MIFLSLSGRISKPSNSRQKGIWWKEHI